MADDHHPFPPGYGVLRIDIMHLLRAGADAREASMAIARLDQMVHDVERERRAGVDHGWWYLAVSVGLGIGMGVAALFEEPVGAAILGVVLGGHYIASGRRVRRNSRYLQRMLDRMTLHSTQTHVGLDGDVEAGRDDVGDRGSTLESEVSDQEPAGVAGPADKVAVRIVDQ